MRLPHALALALLGSAALAHQERPRSAWKPLEWSERLTPGKPVDRGPLQPSVLEAAGPLEPAARGPEPFRLAPGEAMGAWAAVSADGARAAWLMNTMDAGQSLTTGPLPAGPWTTRELSGVLWPKRIAFAGDAIVGITGSGRCALREGEVSWDCSRAARRLVLDPPPASPRLAAPAELEYEGVLPIPEARAGGYALSPDGATL